MDEQKSSRGVFLAAVCRSLVRLCDRQEAGRAPIGLTLSLASVAIGVGLMGWALANIGAPVQRVVASGYDFDHPSIGATAAVGQTTSTAEATSTKAPVNPPSGKTSPRTVAYAKHPSPGDVLGTLSIPALKQALPIIEGTRTSDLKKGVGHYATSVFPGQNDNCVLSAHRDTFFSRLGELEEGDRVTVQTAAGTYVYEINRIRVVGKEDRTIIVPTDHGVLTLTTCYPFNYIGSAPKRYVVSADLVESR